MSRDGTTAIITLTKNGAELGERLLRALENSHLFVPSRYGREIPAAHTFGDGVAAVVERAFKDYDRLVLVFSVGIAVRLIARSVESKRTDPAVVVMDEKGQFAISLLSGHLGGANALARHIARLIGAVPVITTASDIAGTLSVDLLGEELGWTIEDWTNVTRTSAAVVNGEVVGVFQDAGEAWWPEDRPLPSNIRVFHQIADLQASDVDAALIITDRLLGSDLDAILSKSVVYRPKSLAVGLGCNRGTTCEEIESAVRATLLQHGLSFASIRSVATIDVKRSEVGLMKYANRFGIRIGFFSSDELDNAKGVVNPSETVRRAVGCRSVCEAAALLSAGAEELLVPKTKVGNVAIAIARTPFGGQTG